MEKKNLNEEGDSTNASHSYETTTASTSAVNPSEDPAFYTQYDLTGVKLGIARVDAAYSNRTKKRPATKGKDLNLSNKKNFETVSAGKTKVGKKSKTEVTKVITTVKTDAGKELKRKTSTSEKESKKKPNTKAENKPGKEVQTRKTNAKVAAKKKNAAKAMKPKRKKASK